MPMNFALLRLLLALSIAVSHFHTLTGTTLVWAVPFAAIDAVPAFFVVSGWIVSASLLASRSGLAFQLRRLARILPAYLVVIGLQTAGVLVWALAQGGASATLWADTLRYLGLNLALMNFVQPSFAGFLQHAAVPAINPSLWTMKIEVGFYLLLPALMAARRQWGPLALVAVAGLSTAWVLALQSAHPDLARQLPGQLRYFVAGMCCQWLGASRSWPAVSRGQWLALGLLGLALSQLSRLHPLLTAIQPLAVTAMVVAASLWLPALPARWPDLSYGIYLLHAPLVQFGVQCGWIPPGAAGLLGLLALCGLGAWALHRWVEQPGVAWGRRWSARIETLQRPNPSGAADTAATPALAPCHVAILLCTYQGEAFLRRQLDTILAQTHTDWSLHVSDDGSRDTTPALLADYQQRLGNHRLQLYAGPQQGFAANFFSLIGRPAVQADCYAFTDQDDEWDACKLQRAVAALAQLPAGQPGIYGSRSALIDARGKPLGLSRRYQRQPGFTNALVQNMATGNTMVLNAAAARLIREAGTDVKVSAHDWWAYLLVTGSGGTLVYDPYPTIRYRQHGANLYGANRSLKARWQRALRLMEGDFQRWNNQNLQALHHCRHRLTAQSLASLALFEHARQGPLWRRLVNLWRSGVYRQTWDGQLGLLVAVLTRRL